MAAIQAQLKKCGIDEAKIVTALLPISCTVWNEWHLGNARAECVKDIAKYLKYEEVEGNVAECRVFHGDTAKIINYHLRDKMLYLFDIFQGFDMRDIQTEN